MTEPDHSAPVMDQEFWDQRYRAAAPVWAGHPHAHLVAETAALAPGSALDVGTGEGADAIWLAERGWRVTAVDISPVALERGAAQADTLGPEVAGKISWVHADLAEWAAPVGAYDLVSAQFIHLASALRVPLYDRLAQAVAPEGTLLLVGHHPSDLQTTVRRLPDPDPLFTAEELVAELAGDWTILVAESRPRDTRGRQGEAITIHDTVLLATRGT